MKAVWLLLLCIGVWTAVTFAAALDASDEELVNGLKDNIDDKVKTALAEATGDEEEIAEEAADVQDDSDEAVAEEEEAEENTEESSISRRKRTPLFNRRFAAEEKRTRVNALGRRLHAVLVLAAKACGGVKDLECLRAAILKHKKSDADGEVLKALLVGGAAGLKLECRSTSKRMFSIRSFAKRDLSETLTQKITRIALVLKASEATCVATETGALNVKKCVLKQTVSALTNKHERRMAFALVYGLVEGYKAHCKA